MISCMEQIEREAADDEAAHLLVAHMRAQISGIPALNHLDVETRRKALLLVRDEAVEALRDSRLE